jgi:hypothetical protein
MRVPNERHFYPPDERADAHLLELTAQPVVSGDRVGPGGGARLSQDVLDV